MIVGTFAAISPSFMIGAHAQQYGMDSYDDKQSYGKDNSYKSKDSSNVIVKKIKCNNINANVNGFNGVEVGTLPTALTGLATDEAQASDESEIGASGSDGGRPSGSDTDSRFVCINNNDFNVQTNLPDIEEESNLIVNKEVTCQRGDNSGASIFVCRDFNAGQLGQPQITPDDFTITVTGNNPTPSQFEGSSIPVIVNLGVGAYQVSETADPSVSTTITNIEQTWGADISQSVIFSGDCDAMTGEGTIAEGELQICHIQNVFTATQAQPWYLKYLANNGIIEAAIW